jgi:ubiquinone/menaquinone biosynthesis C-methylase UbiE
MAEEVSALSQCRYCAQIHKVDASYPLRQATFDLESDCPRCARHWRYVCQQCGDANHFHATFFCQKVDKFICFRCALDTVETVAEFWAWEYHYVYRCPLCDGVHPGLDYAEFLGEHPYQQRPEWEAARQRLAPDRFLPRRVPPPPTITPADRLTDDDVAASWDAKAERWDGFYDQEGDRNRKYQSDEILFGLLGEVAGQRILDAGCGQGYLSRILARRGASVAGVENSHRFYELALAYQAEERLDIVYHRGSISNMPYLEDASFDAIVCNYVLMDTRDYEGAVGEFARVLRPEGVAVVVISHPCFHTPGSGWLREPPDSLRREDRARWLVDRYFDRGAWQMHWHPYDTAFVVFHRTLSDYYGTFQAAGLRVTDLKEPSVTARGERELAPYHARHLKRIPYSVAFRLQRE